jgi:hypothetical protein
MGSCTEESLVFTIYDNSLSLKSSIAYFNSRICGMSVRGYAGSYAGLGISDSSVIGALGRYATSEFARGDAGRVCTTGPLFPVELDVNPSVLPQTFSIIITKSIPNPITIKAPNQSI